MIRGLKKRMPVSELPWPHSPARDRGLAAAITRATDPVEGVPGSWSCRGAFEFSRHGTGAVPRDTYSRHIMTNTGHQGQPHSPHMYTEVVRAQHTRLSSARRSHHGGQPCTKHHVPTTCIRGMHMHHMAKHITCAHAFMYRLSCLH